MNETIGGFQFTSNFDSGNLAQAVLVDRNEFEFNLWTVPDCANTPFENGNRTWFYFNVKGPANKTVKFNIMNLNRQAKLYSQGMKPLYRVLPHQPNWERIREKPTFSMDDHTFILSFKFTFPSDEDSTVSFAFCYPYSYTKLQEDLNVLDHTYSNGDSTVYFKRDLLCKSLEHRRVDVLTVTSKGTEDNDKPVVFISARVHPGETPSSYVIKGFLEFILKEDDIRAQKLREKFIFKIIPMLNPDGVFHGHYRTDTRGVNLNRVYLDTNPELHPTIAAVKELILSHKSDDIITEMSSLSSLEHQVKESLIMEPDDSSCQDNSMTHWPSKLSENTPRLTSFAGIKFRGPTDPTTVLDASAIESSDEISLSGPSHQEGLTSHPSSSCDKKNRIFAYIDLHGHASKRGMFMYGNHFKDSEKQVECLLLPKLVSLNSQHFDFWACNFTEKNMYLKDKRDGLSKEGSGRVAVYKLTGLIRSYTLECNYNTGRMRNVLSPLAMEKHVFHATTDDIKDENDRYNESLSRRRRTVSAGFNIGEAFLPAVPYSEKSFEEVGEALAVSLLDLIGANPRSRLPQSIFGDVDGVRHWIRLHCLSQRPFHFVDADLDDESAGPSLPPPPTITSSQQVTKSESGGAKAKITPVKLFSRPGKCYSPVESSSLSKDSLVRTRVPWPATGRHKESPNQSPKQATHSEAVHSPTSPTLHFPKQPKSPATARRLRRKKSLKKSKGLMKKEMMDGAEGSFDVGASPPSPPKMLKRKRQNSKSLSETKDKRPFKSSLSTGDTKEIDPGIASTSTTLKSKSSLVKKKNLVKKRNSTLKKK